MTKNKKIGLGILVFMLALLGAGFYHINKQAIGLPTFYIWKAVSGKAHGGQYADVNGIRLYYETYGAGSPVLVLHGGTAFIESMHYQIGDLAADHLVIAPDSRGHGRSTDGAGALHYAQMTDDMVALLDQLKIAKIDIVGWSDGGIIALDMAIRYADRVGHIAISGSNFNPVGLSEQPNIEADPDSEAVAGQRDFYKRLAPDPTQWPALYRKVLSMWASEPNFTTAQLATIKAPTLVIAGEFDSIKREHTDALAEAIPGAKKVIIDGADHFAPVTHHGEVNAHIVELLKFTE
ncbi:MAG TPA: alpha/beta hydrolase [Spongiibacteraceae bacterium]|nr:alpha/beta hydrolase [Spongiibacteraceae bacterium]